MGAVERITELCVDLGVGYEVKPMTDGLKSEILHQMDMLADQGMESKLRSRVSPTRRGVRQDDVAYLDRSLGVQVAEAVNVLPKPI